VFLNSDFLQDTGIPAIREHLRQKLAYSCFHEFSGPFGPERRFFEANRGRAGVMLTPNELLLTSGGCYLCATFGKNRSRNMTVRVQTDRRTHAQRKTGFIICPILHAIAMGQIKIS